MALKEYTPGTAFPGVVGRTVGESQPAWPRPLRAKPGAPNVLFIVLDDTGFGQLGCYGSPIRTPNLDRLAAGGLRFNNMHTTALCSPSRSCMLTGRNHHSNAMSCITEGATGYPGSNGMIPFENGFLSEMLLPHGYNTFAIGKWHLTPTEQCSAAGPYDRWPLGRGFERFYGFMGGDTSQYFPDLVFDNHQVNPPGTPEQGYHLTEDLVDHAIEFIADSRQVAPEKPFFMYFCTGAMHAPHHVPSEWADKYKGQFDGGWDAYRVRVYEEQLKLGLLPPGTKLSERDPDVAAWDSLGGDEKRLYARMMEVFAGFLEHTDHHIGRLLSFLEKMGQLDDTLIMVVSDNGASAEGGPHGSVNENLFFNNVPETLEDNLKAIDDLGGPKVFNHYPWGWAWAGNTPFRRWKRETYRGGACDPFIAHWPAGIKAKGEVRDQYAHIIDMVPTVLDALGVEPPAAVRGVTQSPIQGVSFAHAFTDAKAETRHHTQYFEMMGHRAIYHDGWRAVCPVPGPSFAEAGMGFGAMVITEDKLRELDAKGWELYHVDKDFSETRQPGGRQSRQADRDDRDLVRGGRQVQRVADRRARGHAVGRRKAAARAAPRPLRLLPADVGGLEQDRAAHPQPPAQHHRDGRHRQRRRRRAGGAGELVGGLRAVRQGSQAALRVQLPGGTAVSRRHRRDHRRRQTRAARRAGADGAGRHRTRQGDAGARAALHRRQAGGPGRPAGHHPDRHRHHRWAVVRARRGLGGDDRLPGAVCVHRAARKIVVDVSGELIEDKDAQMRSVMAHQ